MSKRSFYLLIALYAAGLLCGLALLFLNPRRDVPFARRFSGAFAKNTVAVVEVYGPIYVSQNSSPLGISRDADRTVRKLHKINKMPNVKAVVMRINSPGGSVGAVQEICREIEALRKNGKVVIASLGDIAASGGYYVASQCDAIYAEPGTLTGSIGVIMEVANVQELFKKVGLKMTAIRSGKFKDIASPFRELTAEEQSLLQDLIDDAYGQFVDAVAAGRKMDRAKVLTLADGRIFSGQKARELGLLDAFGNSEEAIAEAARRAKIPGAANVLYDTDIDSFGQLFGIFGESSRVKIPFVSERKVRLDYMLE